LAVQRRSTTSIVEASGIATRSVMWPTTSSIMKNTGTR
jgi:hypothetical protein